MVTADEKTSRGGAARTKHPPAPIQTTMSEETKRTLLMAAATLASGTMSIMQTSEWSGQMPGVVKMAFQLLKDEYENLPPSPEPSP
jgi:hypothetical protein